MDALNTSCFTAFIGIDWADTKHDVCIQSATGEPKEFGGIVSKGFLPKKRAEGCEEEGHDTRGEHFEEAFDPQVNDPPSPVFNY